MNKKTRWQSWFANVVLLLVLLITAFPAQGQDYIKEVSGISCDTSIVREYTDSKRVIYNAHYGGNQFIMVSENGTTAYVVELKDEITVFDFKIVNDTLYFCGRAYTGSLVGVFGFIPLIPFPTTVVSCYYLSEFSRLGKMEYLKSMYDASRHFVMTGTTRGGKDCVVDAKRFPGGWTFFYSQCSAPAHRLFEDVAVTKNQVVVAARGMIDSTAYLYYFSHPAAGGNIFTAAVSYCTLPDTLKSRIQLEACHDNYFVATFQSKYNASKWLNVLTMDGFTFIREVFIPVSTTSGINWHHAVDIKYNPDYNEVDLLSNEKFSSYYNSVIYHVSNKGSVSGRRYYGQHICSLDYLSLDPSHFIGTGSGTNGELWFYKYNPHLWAFCSEYEFVMPISNKYDLQFDYVYPPFEVTEESLSIVLFNTDSTEIKTRCYYDMKEDEE